VLEFVAKSLAERNCLGRNMVGGRQVRKKEKERKRIIKISQSVDKCRVALLDDMIQGKFWRMVFLKAGGVADFSTSKGSSNLLRKRFLVTELSKQGLVQEV
jgi:hypothetical protein